MAEEAESADGQPAPELSGLQKTAIVMLACGEEHAGKLFNRLELDEIKQISQAMAGLGVIPGETVEWVLQQFAERYEKGGALTGGMDSVERMLSSFLDMNKVASIMEEIRGPIGNTVWDKLSGVNEEVLASYLNNEYPQTIAVVISRIKPDHAARVLAALPEDVASDAVLRMLRSEPVRKEIMLEVERSLRTDFMTNFARTSQRDNHEIMADIFNHLDRSSETRMLEMLEDRNKEAADRVRSLMFTFEDMTRIDPTGIQTLLRQVDTRKLALALKGASDDLRALFTGNMSERAGKMLRDDMEALGPVRLRDVEETQAELITLAKDLADKGEIVIAGGKDEEVMV